MNAERTRSFHRVAPEVLEGIYQHRLLSTPQVHALFMADKNMRWAQDVLADLTNAGLVQSVNTRTRAPTKLHFLTPLGQESVESAPRLETRRVQVTPEGAAGSLQAHTLALNDVGISFVTAARARDDECGPLAWRHELSHPIGPGAGRGAKGGDVVIADAVLRYTRFDGDRVDLRSLFVEVDRATMPLEDLAAKMRRYARLHSYVPDGESEPGWTQLYQPDSFPEVLVVFGGKERPALERRMESLLAVIGRDPVIRAKNGAVVIRCCLLADLVASGPFDPIFLRHDDPGIYVDWLGHG